MSNQDLMKYLEDREFIVFGAEHYTNLGVVRTLGRAGFRPDIIALSGRADLPVMSCSKYVGNVYKASSVEEGYKYLMSQLSSYEKKPIVLTGNDAVLSFLDARYDEHKDKIITFNAGKNNGVNKYMNKTVLQELAQSVGLLVAKTYSVNTGEIPNDIDYPVITKAENPTVGGWKSDVYICHNENELREACSHISSPRILIQKYVEKINELSYSGFSVDHGNQTMFSMMNNELYTIEAYYNPYHTVENPSCPEFEEKLALMLKIIGFEGIWSAEFLEDADHNYYFTEINFRQSAWDWSCDIAGNPLSTMWAASMIRRYLRQEEFTPIKEGFRGLVEPIDYSKRVLSGKSNIFEWMHDILTADCLYYYDKDDMAPFELLMTHPNDLL